MPQKKKTTASKTLKFRRGDVVTITRKATTHERGWQNSWIPEMDSAVGHLALVMETNPDLRHDVLLDTDGEEDGFGFPDFVLKLVKAKK